MTTQHTCGGPVFGRKPVKWAPSRRDYDAQRCREIDAHFAGHAHQSGACGPVCTFGDW